MEEDDVGGTGSRRGGDVNCKQNFGQKILRTEAIWKTCGLKKKSSLLLNK